MALLAIHTEIPQTFVPGRSRPPPCPFSHLHAILNTHSGHSHLHPPMWTCAAHTHTGIPTSLPLGHTQSSHCPSTCTHTQFPIETQTHMTFIHLSSPHWPPEQLQGAEQGCRSTCTHTWHIVAHSHAARRWYTR